MRASDEAEKATDAAKTHLQSFDGLLADELGGGGLEFTIICDGAGQQQGVGGEASAGPRGGGRG